MSTLLAFGDVGVSDVLNEVARTTGQSLVRVMRDVDAERALDQETTSAVLVDSRDEAGLALAVRLRASEKRALIPMFGLDQAPTDLSFARALNWGIDDLAGVSDPWSLITRLRAVSSGRAGVPMEIRGACVAEPEIGRRFAIGRALRLAGFEVTYCRDALDLVGKVERGGVDVVVVSSAVLDEVDGLAARALTERSIRTIVSAVGKDELALEDRYFGHPTVRVMNTTSPPENAIFLANELGDQGLLNKRASPRELYGTAVWFRPEGQAADEVGYTYNVSLEGLYVRTLAPPTQDLVWLELVPPRSTGRVRLVGRVAWRRPYGPNSRATAPPGFGVRIVDGSRADQERWQQGVGAPLASASLKSRRAAG